MKKVKPSLTNCSTFIMCFYLHNTLEMVPDQDLLHPAGERLESYAGDQTWGRRGSLKSPWEKGVGISWTWGDCFLRKVVSHPNQRVTKLQPSQCDVHVPGILIQWVGPCPRLSRCQPYLGPKDGGLWLEVWSWVRMEPGGTFGWLEGKS